MNRDLPTHSLSDSSVVLRDNLSDATAPASLPNRFSPFLQLGDPARPLHVLLVDDDRLSRIMLASMLAASSLRVDQAVNGRDALNRFCAQPFDVVVTGLRMPIMDGETLASCLRQHEAHRQLPACRLIALAPSLELPTAAAPARSLFNAALEKPACLGDILEAIFDL